MASVARADAIAVPAMPDTPVHTQGKVVDRRDDVLYLVELPNGKQVLAHLSKACVADRLLLGERDIVLLEMTPYDFDHARIIGKV